MLNRIVPALTLLGIAFAVSLVLPARTQAHWQAQFLQSTPFSKIAPATPAGALIKAGAGRIFSAHCGSTQAAVAVLKVYDTATARTCGAGVPIVRLVCPGATAGGNGTIRVKNGKTYSDGLGYCGTGALADADTTAISANSVAVNMDFQ